MGRQGSLVWHVYRAGHVDAKHHWFSLVGTLLNYIHVTCVDSGFSLVSTFVRALDTSFYGVAWYLLSRGGLVLVVV